MKSVLQVQIFFFDCGVPFLLFKVLRPFFDVSLQDEDVADDHDHLEGETEDEELDSTIKAFNGEELEAEPEVCQPPAPQESAQGSEDVVMEAAEAVEPGDEKNPPAVSCQNVGQVGAGKNIYH